MADSTRYIKLYTGYGHAGDLLLYGHLFQEKPPIRLPESHSWIRNSLRLLGLFLVKPIPRAKVRLQWNDTMYETETEDDGFIKFEWKQEGSLDAGRHAVTVSHTWDGQIITCAGELVVPHITQYAFISDVDDTVLKSYSATTFRRMRALLANTPESRKVFDQVAEFYNQLSLAHTENETPNPFFYVSSSEWNLFNYLEKIFSVHGLPRGVFLLNQLKHWYELWKTGKTRHEGKLARIVRVLHTYPNQRFVLIGDNTQKDPVIYEKIARRYPNRIHAILIRNIIDDKAAATVARLNALEHDHSVMTCLFSDSLEAISFCKKAGLIGASSTSASI